MATMDIEYGDESCTWDCSCGEEDQPGDNVWDWESATCRACGARFDLELDGGTEEGFYLLAVEAP